jgi:hypothetical protein
LLSSPDLCSRAFLYTQCSIYSITFFLLSVYRYATLICGFLNWNCIRCTSSTNNTLTSITLDIAIIADTEPYRNAVKTIWLSWRHIQNVHFVESSIVICTRSWYSNSTFVSFKAYSQHADNKWTALSQFCHKSVTCFSRRFSESSRLVYANIKAFEKTQAWNY